MRPKPANRYLRTLILQRERSLAQKAVYRFLEVAFRRRLNRHYAEVNELVRLRRFAVMSPADLDMNLYRQRQGGDYWAAYELIKALGESGYLGTDEEPDVVSHCFGAPMDLPPRAYKILWIYSHPEQVTAELLGRYDRIFCLSAPFVAKIKEMGFTAKLAVGATSPWDGEEPDQMYDYDIVFVGNNRGDDRMNLRALSRLSHRV